MRFTVGNFDLEGLVGNYTGKIQIDTNLGYSVHIVDFKILPMKIIL